MSELLGSIDPMQAVREARDYKLLRNLDDSSQIPKDRLKVPPRVARIIGAVGIALMTLGSSVPAFADSPSFPRYIDTSPVGGEWSGVNNGNPNMPAITTMDGPRQPASRPSRNRYVQNSDQGRYDNGNPIRPAIVNDAPERYSGAGASGGGGDRMRHEPGM